MDHRNEYRWREALLADPTIPAPNRRRLEQDVARRRLRQAVRRGEIIKPGLCSRCWEDFPKNRIHAHHEDYTKPLDVRWLCAGCHSAVHAIKNMPNWDKP